MIFFLRYIVWLANGGQSWLGMITGMGYKCVDQLSEGQVWWEQRREEAMQCKGPDTQAERIGSNHCHSYKKQNKQTLVNYEFTCRLLDIEINMN